jgi:hypothetical protein
MVLTRSYKLIFGASEVMGCHASTDLGLLTHESGRESARHVPLVPQDRSQQTGPLHVTTPGPSCPTAVLLGPRWILTMAGSCVGG